MSTSTVKFNEAARLHQRGQFAPAQMLCDELLAVEPHHADALHLLGLIAYQTNNPQRAVQLIGRAISINFTNPIFYSNYGNALQMINQWEAAIKSYDRAVTLNPDFVDAYFNRAGAQQMLMLFDAAIESYSRSIKIKPNFAEAYGNRANVLQLLKRWEEALTDYDRAIALKPDFIEAYVNRGLVLQEIKQFEEAIKSYDHAIRIHKNFSDAYFNRGNALRELKQFVEAIKSYDQAININPNFSDAYFNRGNTFLQLKQLEKAIESYDQVIMIQADNSDAYFNRGKAQYVLGRFKAAVESYDCAIAIKPDFAEVYVSRGNTLQKLMQFNAAVESYNHAISIKTDYTEAYIGRGAALQELKKFEAVVETYKEAVVINPNFNYLLGLLIHAKMHLCDWSDFEENTSKLIEKIEQGEKASIGFSVLPLTMSPAIQRKATEMWMNDVYPMQSLLGNIPKHGKSEKIRLGYFSADFHFHPVMILLAELFELHDKNRFELIAFSFGPETNDVMQQRVRKAFDKFIDVRHQSDQEVALLAREMKIDIAVDLGGGTKNTRPGIFSYRAAPIQVDYLGWPGTMGVPYFDYLIADSTLIPKDAEQYYLEKIVCLPNSYQANDTKRKIADKVFSRAELGLPDKGFIFCCFNNSFKITPDVFDGWMRILKATPGSVLFLYADDEQTKQNLRKEAEVRGIDSLRLVFGKRLMPDEYLARYKVADLFLNTFPYDAGTTASDALWAGLPVLTRVGETFVSRVAASLLKAIRLPELITHSQEDYEALAIGLANNPDKLNKIKEKLAANRSTAPLFNTKLFAKHIEDGYIQMIERYQADLPPDHIYVAD